MRNKRILGVIGIVFGALLLLTLVLPWFNVGVIIVGKVNLYPLWAGSGYNLAHVKFSNYSYISGILLILAAILMIGSGVYLTAKNKGYSANAVMLIGAVVGVISMVFYIFFVVKSSPDTNGNYFYGSTSLYNYALQMGFYIEAGLSIIMVVLSSIFLL